MGTSLTLILYEMLQEEMVKGQSTKGLQILLFFLAICTFILAFTVMTDTVSAVNTI